MKALIIGYGSIGCRHANIISEMKEFQEINILSMQKGLPFNTITELKDIEKINPDYIVIASSTSLHFEQLKYIENNFEGKIILVEKPLFNKFHELKIFKNKVYIGYNLRFHPMIKKIKQICTNRKLWSANIFCGSYLPDWRPSRDYRYTSSAKRVTGGGVLLDLSHELDYIRWIFGEISVAHVYNEKISNLEIDSDDLLILTGKTENSTKLNISMNYFTRKKIRNIIIDGEGVSIQADLIDNKMSVFLDDQEKSFNWPEVGRNYTYIAQHKALVDSNFTEICSFSEGMETMKLIDHIKSNSM